MTVTASAELPRWQCHKTVHAVKMAGYANGTVYPADPTYAPFEAPTAWDDRYRGTDTDPGYYVVYEDGYVSWSPTKAFEEGYTRL